MQIVRHATLEMSMSPSITQIANARPAYNMVSNRRIMVADTGLGFQIKEGCCILPFNYQLGEVMNDY